MGRECRDLKTEINTMANTEMANRKDMVNISGPMDHITKVTFIMVCARCKESIANRMAINTKGNTKTIVNMDLAKYIILMGAFSKEHSLPIKNKVRVSFERRKEM